MNSSRTISFDGWLLRTDLGELIRGGQRIRLQQRPLLVLDELLAHPGELVTREQLIARLWPKGVVDFDTGLNTAVRKLRVALDDTGEEPRYIETIPRRGYRFVGTLDPPAVEPPPEEAADTAPATSAEPTIPPTNTVEPPRGRGSRLVLALAAVFAVALGVYLLVRREPEKSVWVTHPSAALLAASDRPAIALLPLAANTGAAPDDMLGKIVSDVLRQRMSRFENVTIIRGASPIAMSDGTALRRFGDSVHARYLLGGTVIREQDRFHLQLQVIEVGSGSRVAAFDDVRAASELAGLVDKAVNDVVRALHIRIEQGRESTASPPINLEAYATYVRAEELLKTQQTQNILSALELFRRATVLDPSFARAYLGWARAAVSSQTGFGPEAEAEQRRLDAEANTALDRALELDPELGEAYVQRARVTEDLTKLDALFQKGLRLAPNYAEGWLRYGEFLNDEYRRGEALEAIERAYALDPLDPRLMVRVALHRYYRDSQVEPHDRLVREALAIQPKYVGALGQLSYSTWYNRGQFAEAAKYMEKVVQVDPDAEDAKADIASIYLDAGDLDAALAVLKLRERPAYSAVEVAQYQHDPARAARLARDVVDGEWRTRWTAPEAWALRDDAIRTGDFSYALKRMDARYALNVPWGPAKNTGPRYWNRTLGLVYAHTLALAGETQRGRKLAQLILAQLDGEAVGRAPHTDAQDRAAALMILGDKEGALAELNNSLDIGHYVCWWYFGELDPLYSSLHADPRFQALVARVKEHREQQRALLDELRRSGEIPDRVAAARH